MSSFESRLFTLLICTHNRALLVRRCMEELAELRVPDGVTWEILVVDNGSTDGTEEEVQSLARQWPELTIRLLREERQGVAYARKTGISSAVGQWVALVDDDCLLEKNWMEEAVRFVTNKPQAGAFGGRNVLVWERVPNDLCLAYGESLARQDWGDELQKVAATGKGCLCGAGLVLNREALLATGYLEKGALRGRHPVSIGAGEDTEMQLLLRNAGWDLWYVPTLHLRHWIPASRMELRHLILLHHGFGMAEIHLRLLGESRPLTWSNRWLGLQWAMHEMGAVLGRFWLGFVCYRNERPTWIIRLWYAAGCLKGALRLLVLGQVK